ncbi:MAG: bifunctional D-glycero-beta-D-manno-heptose-7-phosphate kinase/D-glycero-beta-D-manno-heptose 1-phosphate adenylyltransferase HldE [Candidatus Tectimicrobiota bacterium]
MDTLVERCFQRQPPRVLVLGDVMCDVYLWGAVRRISPEAPVPVFESATRHHILGGAANVAANLRALGCHVHLLGVVGADAAGEQVRNLLVQRGIDETALYVDPTRPTTEKTRLMAQQQQVLRLDQESRAPLSPACLEQALRQAGAVLAQVDGVVCSDYQKGVCTPALLQPLFAMARAAGLPIIVDPKVRDFTHYHGATVLTPNLTEVEQACGTTVTNATELAQAAHLLLQQSQATALLVTQGKDGMTLFQPPQAPVHIPARAREVFDVTGAGDTALAALSMAMLCGVPLLDAARLANAAAGIVVGKVGTAVVTPDELRIALREERGPSQRKILPAQALAAVIREHQQRGECVVFTNGCFDLLHVGHIQYLQQARALGQRLVVALNDDASVRQLKGAHRPLIPQQERTRILAALECVDYVTTFSEATPLELITLVRPDILVKGGDYTPETVVGHDVVAAYGGRVCIMPYVAGVSTTEIIGSIVERYR